MDILDRTTRLDVVPGTTAPAASGPAATSAQEGDAPSFADSLARPARGATPANGDESRTSNFTVKSGETAAPEKATPEPAGSAESDVANDQPSTNPAPRTVVPQAAVPTAVDATDAYDETIHVLLSGLITAATVAPPSVASPTNQELPAPTPPASLMAALQTPAEIPTPPIQTAALQTAAPLPAIPFGLLQGMTYRGNGGDANQDVPPVPVPRGTMDAATPAADFALTHESAAPVAMADVPASFTQLNPASMLSPTWENTSSSRHLSGSSTATDLAAPSSELTVPDIVPAADAASPADVAVREVFSKGEATNSRSADHASQRLSSSASQLDHSPRDLLDFATSLGMVPSLPNVAYSPGGNNSTANARAEVNLTAGAAAPHDGMWLSPVSGPIAFQTGVDLAVISINAADGSGSSSAQSAPNVVEQLRPLLHLATTQDRELTMTLRPPELGAVRIDVQHRDGQMSARLQTETAAAHQLLTDQLPQLREVLTQLGIASDQVQVIRSETLSITNQSGLASDRQTDAQQSGNRQDSPSQPPPEPQRIDDPERDDAPRPAILTRTALNLRI